VSECVAQQKIAEFIMHARLRKRKNGQEKNPDQHRKQSGGGNGLPLSSRERGKHVLASLKETCASQGHEAGYQKSYSRDYFQEDL
jgi:hypothetical protein